MIYTVTVNPALDYVMHVDALRFDDINRTTGESLFYGGKGINVSVVLTRLGVETCALGFLAGFTGRQLEDMLLAEGVACDFHYLTEGYTRINVKIKAGTELDINARGPAASPADVAALVARTRRLGPKDFLVLAGSIPSTLPDDLYETLLAEVEGSGARFVVDATGELLRRVLKFRPFLVKPNHHELGDLFGVSTETDGEIETYARRLQEMGARNVLVSRASKGALLVDETGGVHTIGVAKGKLVNSVGCGDSMVAGFLAGYVQTGDYAHALRLGSACGGATAFSEGLGTKDGILAVYDSLKQ